MKRNITLALIFNILSIVLFSIGFYIALNEGRNVFAYYTQDANLLTAISSLIFIIYLVSKKEINEIPQWVLILRYVGTVCEVVTLIIVVTVLIPTVPGLSYFEGFKLMMLSGSMLYHHLLCPVLSLVSFILFEGDRRLNKKKTMYYPLIPTFVYGLVLLILNALKKVDGPYPFFRIYNQPWYMTILWVVIILVGNYLIARYVLLFNQIRAPRIRKNKV